MTEKKYDITPDLFTRVGELYSKSVNNLYEEISNDITLKIEDDYSNIGITYNRNPEDITIEIKKPFIKIGITYNGNPEDITIEIKKPSIKIDYGRAPKKGKTIYEPLLKLKEHYNIKEVLKGNYLYIDEPKLSEGTKSRLTIGKAF